MMKDLLQTRNWMAKATAVLLQGALLASAVPAQEQQANYTFRAETEIVLVNVSVRDKSGNFVRNLKADDFKVVEDGKPQKILSFDVENTDVVPPSSVAQAAGPSLSKQPAQPAPQKTPQNEAEFFKDRRLIILFFDLSAMEPDEIDTAATAAENYVDKEMEPADLVSIISLGSDLEVNQDFTDDRAQLKKVLQSFNLGAGQGYELGTTGTTEGTPDTGQSFTADDTEYNVFNTDRRLEAIRSIAEKLEHVQQRKSLIYFSGGMTRTGIENESELRAATNAAVRANMAIYTMDARGLQAMVPGGEAQNASMQGTSPYSGKAMLSSYSSNFSSQETLVTLAGDTGGRAFLDTNDFSRIFRGVQEDTETYYVLGYHSTNPARDGKYRRITVSINQSGLKLDYRRGYYAPADFKHSNSDDRERQLQEELASQLPSTDLPVYLSAGYFRISPGKFFVPISIVVPGSEIPFVTKSNEDKATLDIIGAVEDPNKRPMDEIRDTVKLAVNTSTEVRRKNVEYNNGFFLPPGKYHLKFVVRENETGRMGSFETDLTIPDMKDQPLKMSTVVLSSQIKPIGRRRLNNDPLFRDGSEIVPSVTHVFSNDQHLYFYYEVYQPGEERDPKDAKKGGGKDAAGDVRLLTNVAFFQGRTKAFETPLIETSRLNDPSRKAAIFQLEVPLAQLKPGFYICQVNVIDDASGRFLFPRLALLVRH
jgi:VWFA-related protein